MQSMMVQAVGSGFTLLHVLFDVVDTIKKQVSMHVGGYYITDCLDRQMFQSCLERFPNYLCFCAPLDYPHHLCYNRFIISHNASLQINPYYHCCTTCAAKWRYCTTVAL